MRTGECDLVRTDKKPENGGKKHGVPVLKNFKFSFYSDGHKLNFQFFLSNSLIGFNVLKLSHIESISSFNALIGISST